MIAEWRPCYGGYYEASEMGDVRRAKPWTRVFPSGRAHAIRPRRTTLKPHLRRRDGRLYLSICVEGKRILRGVHQVVADAFMGPVPVGLEVNHINGNKLDNRAANLEYVTHAENCAHAGRLGLIVIREDRRGEANAGAKLTDGAVREIRDLHAARVFTNEQIGKLYGVSKSCVDFVGRRVQWSHVT